MPLFDPTLPAEGMPDVASKKKKIKPGSFQGLGLSQTTYRAVVKMGYKTPTPIQRRTIPTILEGQDVVAMARTGSGKTAAFLIPICERLAAHSVSVGVRAVVLSPTRELAMQTNKFFRQLNRFGDLRCCVIVGGQAMEQQFEHLANNPDILIATPGRLAHHVLEAELSLSRVEILVFDEADRLFELGFAEQLQKLLETTPQSRQCLLFSATLPAQLVSFSRAGIRNPVFVRLDVETTLSEALALWFLYIRKEEKLAAAVSMLRRLHQKGKSTIMFVATRHHVEFFGELLAAVGLTVSVVYGSMDQDARTDQVARFRNHKTGILVTTDVAARGIDIPMLDHVVNFDFPPSAKLFVHRAGRTARAGKAGLCISFVTLEDLPYTVELMLFLGNKLTVADDEADKTGGRPVLGSVPGLEHEVETLNRLLADEGTTLKSLHKSMLASYHLYNKTRPSASKQSMARAKELLKCCGGPLRLQSLTHPAFKTAGAMCENLGQTNRTESDKALIQELRGFRPRAEKVGSVISTAASRTMAQAKLDATAIATVRENTSLESDVEDSPTQHGMSAPNGDVTSSAPRGQKRLLAVPVDKPRMSKRQRKQMTNGSKSTHNPVDGQEDFAGWDVKVDGLNMESKSSAVSAAKPDKPTVQQFYLSTERDLTVDAKEQGLEMEKYQMDLLPDDSANIQRTKSVIRWDARKKKYLPVMVSADGRVVKQDRRNESGQKVKGDGEKTNIYKKWVKSTKKRIQKVGELEDGTLAPLGRFNSQQSNTQAVEFSEDGSWSKHDIDEHGRKQKPVVPFHGSVEDKYLTNKQRRTLKKRSNQDQVVRGDAKKELKSVTEMRKEKRVKEHRSLKQKPFLRKEKAKAAKDYRKQLHHERQMKYGARTKAKMLIFDGPPKKRQGGKGGFRAGGI